MFSKVRDIVYFFSSAYFLKRKVDEQNWYTKALLGQLLPAFTDSNDGSLQQKDIRRMHDYPWQFVALFADVFAYLRNKPLTNSERKKLTLFASSGCLYDDFFDDEKLTDQQMKEIYLHPELFSVTTTKEKLCCTLLQEMYEQQSLTTDFESVFLKFYQSQIDSKKQMKDPTLSVDQIRSISFNKGGYALVLSRLLMDELPTEEEREVVWQLGAWFQILDDLLDVEKDRRMNVKTLITSATSVREIEHELKSQTDKTFRLIQSLKYAEDKKDRVIQLYRTISTSGWVQLHRLYQLQKMSGGKFLLQNYTDDQLRWVETSASNYWIGIKYWLIK